MDVNETGRVIHALAAVRAADGAVAVAAHKLGISQSALHRVLAPSSGKFWTVGVGGKVALTGMGNDFPDRISVFPYVNW